LGTPVLQFNDDPLSNGFKRHETMRFAIMLFVQGAHNDYLRVEDRATPGRQKLQDAMECALDELPSVCCHDLPAMEEVLKVALCAIEQAKTRAATRGAYRTSAAVRPSNLFSLELVPLEAQGGQSQEIHN
jgi:hypothetical protein